MTGSKTNITVTVQSLASLNDPNRFRAVVE